MLNTATIGTADQEGVLRALVEGSPDCRAQPVGDGLVGVDGQNCPFQMYSLTGAFKISQSGIYTFSSDSSDGSVNDSVCFNFFCSNRFVHLILQIYNIC